ncbi:M48 family metallopeptidase [Patescibacteria group bacterium]
MKNKIKRNISLRGENVEYVLKRSRRAKNVRLVICCESGLTVIVPSQVDTSRVESFIFQKTEWILRKIKEMRNSGKRSLFHSKTRRDYIACKENARDLVIRRLEFFNKYYNLDYKRVAIRNQRTRWGSCSSIGNLNFNFRIIFLSDELVDYLIVHELCHLQEMNHSREFWKLVEKTIPDHNELSKRLRGM